jgi:PAS domain S-box-containing protein
MQSLGHLTFLSPDGNEELGRTLADAGFSVSTVSDEKDIPLGIVVLDLISPLQAQKYLFGKQDELQSFRLAGYTVVAAVDPETLKDDHAALTIGAAHAFLLKGEGAASTRATILAAIHRRVLDDRLKKSDQQYRLLADHVTDAIWTWNIATRRFEYFSPSVQQLLGYSVKEACGKPMADFLTPESAEKAQGQIDQALKTFGEGPAITSMTDYYDHICKDGTPKTIEISLSFLYGPDGKPTHILGVSRDATERVRDKAILEMALKQRETLLAEMEHRVKNTLAMIASLLSLASGQVKDPSDAELFEESQARVSALALVYQKLLRSSDVSRIDLGVYLEDLCRSMTSAFTPDEDRTDLEVERKDLTVDSKKAALIGLAVNEMITNSLKYAVHPDRLLHLKLEVKPSDDDKFLVAFQDNGPGLPEGFDVKKSGGLGVLLMRSMVEQLKGELATVSSGAGTRYTMTIPNAENGQMDPSTSPAV